MSPLINHQDKMRVQLYDQPKLITKEHIGKILLFKDEYEWISHRLINHNGQLKLKGDFGNTAQSTKNIKAWGEIKEIISKQKKINPHIFKNLICYLSSQYLGSKWFIFKKICKLCIYGLNLTNRYIFFNR